MRLLRLLPCLGIAASLGCVHVPRIPDAVESSALKRVASEPILTVMTLNIAHATQLPQMGGWVGEPTRRGLLEAMGKLIRREQPDIVAMQEVHRPMEGRTGLHHLELIGESSGYANGFFGAHYVGPAKRRDQGTALLANFELESAESKVLSLEPGDDKGFVKATVRVPQWMGRAVDVYSVHLDPYSEKKRQIQVQALADAVRRRDRPVIVMGDFNARYQGPSRALGRLIRLSRLRAHELTGGEPTYPAGWAKLRIDWILISPELEFASHRNVNAGVSDHQGVIAELRLRGLEVEMATRGGGEVAPAAVR